MNYACDVISRRAGAIGCALIFVAACSSSSSDGNGNAGSGPTQSGGAGGQITMQAGTNSVAGSIGDSGHASGGTGQAGAMVGAGGQNAGAPGSGGMNQAGAGGAHAGQSGGGAAGSGGSSGSAGSSGSTSMSSCAGKAWGTADASMAGPFHVMKESDVGPMAGQPDPKYNNTVPKFIVYRPMEMATSGYCHPIVMWSNGHGDQPSTYEVLLNNLTSHGFVVVASLSSIPSQGDPLPAVTGVNWIVQQNDTQGSEFYHHLDTAHIGAVGHSEGGLATWKVSSDPHITAVASVSGSTPSPGLHGPALLFCGGKDTVVPCSSVMTTFSSITNQPAMMVDNLSSDHGSWLYQNGAKGVDIYGITAWMRVHLMGDTENKKLFYGASCTLCSLNSVQVMRNSFLTQ